MLRGYLTREQALRDPRRSTKPDGRGARLGESVISARDGKIDADHAASMRRSTSLTLRAGGQGEGERGRFLIS